MVAVDDASARQAGCKAIVAEKWSLLVINSLGAGPRRFTELKRGIDGISQRMLTVTLRSLERDGLLTRTVIEVMPPNVTYELTSMGTALLEALEPLMQWTVDYLPRIEAARLDYDAARPTWGATPSQEAVPGKQADAGDRRGVPAANQKHASSVAHRTAVV